MASLADFVRDTLPPTAELTDDRVFIHRERLDDADVRLGALHDALKSNPDWIDGRRPRIFDFTFKGTPLGDDNIVPQTFDDPRHYRRVDGAVGPDDPAFDDAARDAEILAPFAARMDATPTLHIDHHYNLSTLTFATTTMLVVDLLGFLHRTGAADRIAGLQSTFPIVDHCDPDIVFAHYALARGGDAAWLKRHGAGLVAATVRNDYAIAPSAPDARRVAMDLYCFGIDLEERLRENECTFDAAFADLDRALATYARGADADAADLAWFEARVFAGGRLTREARDVLARLAPGYRRFDTVPDDVAAADVAPGTLRRLGPALVVFGEDADGFIESAEVVAAVQDGALDGVDDSARVAVTVSHDADGYFVKIRAMPGADGAFNLVPVFARLGAHPRYAALKPGGRRIAGGLCKRAAPDLDAPQAALDVARAIEAEA